MSRSENEKRENRGCLSAILFHLFFRPLFWVFGRIYEWFSKCLIRVYTALILVGTTTLFFLLGLDDIISGIVGVIASICYYYFAREK